MKALPRAEDQVQKDQAQKMRFRRTRFRKITCRITSHRNKFRITNVVGTTRSRKEITALKTRKKVSFLVL